MQGRIQRGSRETRPDRQRHFGKRTKNNEGQGTTLVLYT
jgi:hypothetical protein